MQGKTFSRKAGRLPQSPHDVQNLQHQRRRGRYQVLTVASKKITASCSLSTFQRCLMTLWPRFVVCHDSEKNMGSVGIRHLTNVSASTWTPSEISDALNAQIFHIKHRGWIIGSYSGGSNFNSLPGQRISSLMSFVVCLSPSGEIRG